LDYVAEVDHALQRVHRLEKAIDLAIEQAPTKMHALINGLKTLRGVATVTAVTIVSELGTFSRFRNAPQLMAYAGLVPSESSSGERTFRGRITKTGNAHLRRISRKRRGPIACAPRSERVCAHARSVSTRR
jgi:transposase